MSDYQLVSSWDKIDSAGQNDAAVTAHRQAETNPHKVTKDQVGLGNVENVSIKDMDISDKVQAELDKKENSLGKPVKDGQILTSKIDGTKEWVDKETTGIKGVQGGNGIQILRVDPFNPIIQLDDTISGAEKNVQSDWTETDPTLPTFIKNKPVVPQPNVIVNDLTTGGIDKALSAEQGKVLRDLFNAGGIGTGTMIKSVYDKNDSGVVDNAEKVGGFEVKTSVPADAKFTDTITEVINDLTTGGSDKALSAEQGKNLHARVQTNTDKINANLVRINDLNTTQTSIKTDVVDNKNEIDGIKITANSNQVAVNKNTADITTINAKIVTSNDVINNVKIISDQNKIDIESNKINITTNATKIAENKVLAEDNQTKIIALTQGTNDISAIVAANKTRSESNETKIGDINTRLTADEAKIATNTASIAANETAITANTTKIATNETAIADSTTKITTNTNDIVDLKAADIALDKKIIDQKLGDHKDVSVVAPFQGALLQFDAGSGGQWIVNEALDLGKF